jgi:transposase-like protein
MEKDRVNASPELGLAECGESYREEAGGMKATKNPKKIPCPTCTGYMIRARVEGKWRWWCPDCGAFSPFVKVEK